MKLSGKNVLITGAGGFIGLALIQKCRAEGMNVFGIESSEENARKAARGGCDTLLADILDEAAVNNAMQNIHIVFHTAAVVKEGGSFDESRKINVGGTDKLLRAAFASRINLFIHFSSVMVYGFNFSDSPDENSLLRGDGNPYCQTKIESEHMVKKYFGSAMNTLIIRPGDVYGPGSIPWVVRPLQLMKQGLFFLPDGGTGILNHLYIDNLMEAVFMLLKMKIKDEIFNVTDGITTSVKEYFDWLAHAAGFSALSGMPSIVLKTIAHASKIGYKLLGDTSPYEPDAISFLTRKHPYSIDKIKALGYNPALSLAEGMGRISAWIKSNPPELS